MPEPFNEDNTVESMLIDTLIANGWKYIPADDLLRMHSDVLVEKMTISFPIRKNAQEDQGN